MVVLNQHSISREIVYIFPDSIRHWMRKVLDQPDITEIRLRSCLPLIIRTLQQEFFLSKGGELSKTEADTYIISPQELKIIFQKISQYSVFAYKEELSEGFITLKGGHRIGLCGKIYYDSDGKRQLQHISSMNLRIAREVPGCSADFFPYLIEENSFCHTLLISPPGGGKTTYLRDIIRLISDGTKGFCGQNVSVIDERSEIGNRMGQAEGFYLGKRTDLLDHCRKAEGMLMMLRTMGPQIIAADEIGASEDIDALAYIRNCGCKLLMTIHGKNMDDIMQRPYLDNFLKKYPFERYVVMETGKEGQRNIKIYDEKQSIIWSHLAGG